MVLAILPTRMENVTDLLSALSSNSPMSRAQAVQVDPFQVTSRLLSHSRNTVPEPRRVNSTRHIQAPVSDIRFFLVTKAESRVSGIREPAQVLWDQYPIYRVQYHTRF